MKLPKRQANITRDSILFAFGLLGIVYETVLAHTDRPTLLVLFGACIGLPVFLRTDEGATKKADTAPEAATTAADAANQAELQRIFELEEELLVAKVRAGLHAKKIVPPVTTAETPPPEESTIPTQTKPLDPEPEADQ